MINKRLYKLSSSLVTTFTISSNKLDRKRNIDKFFWRYSSKVHFPLALQNIANLIPKTCFYSILKFLVEILKRLRWQGNP